MRKHTIIALIAALVWFGALAFSGLAVVELRLYDMQLAAADDETEKLLRIVDDAQPGDAERSAEMLEYLLLQFPPEDEKWRNPRVDRIMNRYRTLAIGRILETLRRKTGEDFGEDPEIWIEKMRKRSRDGEAETNLPGNVGAAVES